MLRALTWMVALAALCAAALFVPVAGKSLWERSREHGLPQAASRQATKVAAWVRGVDPAKARGKASSRPRPQEPKAAPAQRKPAEKLTHDDRVALDALVAGSR